MLLHDLSKSLSIHLSLLNFDIIILWPQLHALWPYISLLYSIEGQTCSSNTPGLSCLSFLAVPTAWDAFLWVCTRHTPSSLGLTVIWIRSSCWDLNPGSIATKHSLLMYIQPRVKIDNIKFFSIIILKSSRSEFLKFKNQSAIFMPCTRIIVSLGFSKIMTSLKSSFLKVQICLFPFFLVP